MFNFENNIRSGSSDQQKIISKILLMAAMEVGCLHGKFKRLGGVERINS